MSPFPKYLLLAEFCIAACPSIARAQQTPDAPPAGEVHVLLYDQSQVDHEVLAQAMVTAGRILGATGVGLTWSLCSVAREQPADPHCRVALQPTDFVLLIQTGFSATVSGSALGYATVPGRGEFGNRFSVSLERARFLAAEHNLALARVLGCGIAHEIGHLLLESQAHSAADLMRAKWGHREMVEAARGGLMFTTEEAGRIRAAVRARMQATSILARSVRES